MTCLVNCSGCATMMPRSRSGLCNECAHDTAIRLTEENETLRNRMKGSGRPPMDRATFDSLRGLRTNEALGYERQHRLALLLATFDCQRMDIAEANSRASTAESINAELAAVAKAAEDVAKRMRRIIRDDECDCLTHHVCAKEVATHEVQRFDAALAALSPAARAKIGGTE